MVHKWDNNKEGVDLTLEIVLLLLRKNCHLREMERMLKQPHSTISRKAGYMEKLGILGYREEGKNKIYFIKEGRKPKSYVFSAEEYKLVKLFRKYPELEIILEDVLKKIDDGMIILFGSYANFTADKNSDIDIYVETKSKKIKKSIESVNSKLNVKIGEFDKNSLLIKEIIKNHVILSGMEKFYKKTKTGYN